MTEQTQTPPAASVGGSASAGDTLLQVTDLVRHFPVTRGVVFRHKVGAVRAVDGIDLSVSRGQTLGLVGESGCGKTTTGRLLVRLDEPTGGRVGIDGRDVTNLRQGPMRRLRLDVPARATAPFHLVALCAAHRPFRGRLVLAAHARAVFAASDSSRSASTSASGSSRDVLAIHSVTASAPGRNPNLRRW